MWPYFLLISLPALAVLRGVDRHFPKLLALTFVIYTLFIGLRYEVGPDWQSYVILHQRAAYMGVTDLIGTLEPASFLLFKISMAISNDMLITNLVGAAILLFGVFAFARRTPSPFVAVISATPYLIVAFGMSGMRQAAAIGLVLWMLSNLDRWKMWMKIACIVAAMTFHISALFGACFLLFDSRMNARLKLVSTIVITVLLLGLMSTQAATQGVSVYVDRYTGENQVGAIGSLFHIGILLIPATIAFLFRSKIIDKSQFPNLVLFGSLLAFMLLAANVVSSQAASRLSLYLYFVPMMVYPMALRLIRSPIAPLAFLLLHFMMLFVWLNFANNAATHTPYKTIFASDINGF